MKLIMNTFDYFYFFGLKYLANYGLESAKSVIKETVNLHDMEDSDVLNDIAELRGNIKSLIRNNMEITKTEEPAKTIRWYKVSCSFFKQEFGVKAYRSGAWQAIVNFISHAIGFDYEIKGMYTEFPEDMPEVYLDEKSNQGWGISLPETSSEPEKNSGI